MTRTPKSRLWFVIPGILIVLALAALLTVRIQARHRLADARAAWKAQIERLGARPKALADVPASENAASWMKAAAQILDYEISGGILPQVTMRPAAGWSAEEEQQVEQALQANRQAIALLHRAAQLPRSSYNAEGGHSSGSVPNLLGVLWAGRVLMVSARFHLKRGNEGAALEDLVALSRVASTLEQEHSLILPLVGIACEGFVEAVVHEALASGALTAAGAARLVAALPDADLVHVAQRSVVAESEETAESILGSPLDDMLVQGGILYRGNPDLKPGRAHLMAAVGIPWREATLAYYYRQQSRALEAMTTPYSKLAAADAGPRPSTPLGVLLAPSGSRLFSSAAGRFQGRVAMRRLMRDALRLYAGAGAGAAFPSDLSGTDDGAPELFCECAPIYNVRPDGTAVLSLPGAAPLWTELMGKIVAGAPPLFTWTIAGQKRATR